MKSSSGSFFSSWHAYPIAFLAALGSLRARGLRQRWRAAESALKMRAKAPQRIDNGKKLSVARGIALLMRADPAREERCGMLLYCLCLRF